MKVYELGVCESLAGERKPIASSCWCIKHGFFHNAVANVATERLIPYQLAPISMLGIYLLYETQRLRKDVGCFWWFPFNSKEWNYGSLELAR